MYKGFWKNNDVDILSRLDAASEELKAKRRNNQNETPEESSPDGQNKIDIEDPHPDRPASPSIQMSTQDDLRDKLRRHHRSNAPVEPDDTSDRPTQGDTPYSL